MAMYWCSRCGNLKDCDWDPCIEDPKEEFGEMCGECACEAEEEDENQPS